MKKQSLIFGVALVFAACEFQSIEQEMQAHSNAVEAHGKAAEAYDKAAEAYEADMLANISWNAAPRGEATEINSDMRGELAEYRRMASDERDAALQAQRVASGDFKYTVSLQELVASSRREAEKYRRQALIAHRHASAAQENMTNAQALAASTRRAGNKEAWEKAAVAQETTAVLWKAAAEAFEQAAQQWNGTEAAYEIAASLETKIK